MNPFPTVCYSCGGSIKHIVVIREIISMALSKEVGLMVNTNQFDINSTSVADILSTFGFNSYNHCCMGMINNSRLPTEFSLT